MTSNDTYDQDWQGWGHGRVLALKYTIHTENLLMSNVGRRIKGMLTVLCLLRLILGQNHKK